MNSEFQWRNEMRKLGGPVDPSRDLWPAIAGRLASEPAAQPAASRRRRTAWIAIAATLVVVSGAGLTTYRLQRTPPAPVVTPGPTVAVEPPQAPTQRTALDWATPEDPALAATAQNLDHASAQLQDALEQRPDAVFLVGLLNRTNSMRLRLLRKSPNAG